MRAREFIFDSQSHSPRQPCNEATGIVAYHGTTDTINQFRPLTHFGTEAAARDRMDYKKNTNGKIYKVQLDIRNPFTIKDFPGIHYDRVYAFELRDKKKISQEEMEKITMLQDPAQLRAALLAKVRELGYDGFVYKNRYEDKGNISYVILDPSQAKILEVIPVGEETTTENFAAGKVKGKITLSTDPNWYGAEIGNYKASGPVVNIPTNQLVGFEPDDKMNQPASKANVEKIVAGLKQGAKLPPLMVRKYKNGYQVLDGHHRFWAYKLSRVKSIPSQIVPDEDIIVKENFADGKKPGRKGLAKRVGVDCSKSEAELRKIAKRSSGEKQRMAHWCANMKGGKKK
jgi:hypothetical protein